MKTRPQHRRSQSLRRLGAVGLVTALVAALLGVGAVGAAQASADAPVITELNTPYTQVEGGYYAWATGSGFAETSVIRVAGQPVFTWLAEEDTQLGFEMPAGSPGLAVAITVLNEDDQVSNSVQFRYESPAGPTITGLDPATGSVDGGDGVRVTGTGFQGCEVVTVGGKRASAGTHSDTLLSFVTPANVAGPAEVIVHACDEWIADSNAVSFEYKEPALVNPHWAFNTPTTEPDANASGNQYGEAVLAGAWDLRNGKIRQDSTLSLRPDAPQVSGPALIDGGSGLFPEIYAMPMVSHAINYATPPVAGERYEMNILDLPDARYWGLTGRAIVANSDQSTGVLDRGEGRPAASARYMQAADDGTISVWDFSEPEAGNYWTGGNSNVHLWAETTSRGGTQIPITIAWQFAGLGQIGAGDLEYTIQQGETLSIPGTDLLSTATWSASSELLSPVVESGLEQVTAADGNISYEYIGTEPGEAVFGYALVATGYPDYASHSARIVITTTEMLGFPDPETPVVPEPENPLEPEAPIVPEPKVPFRADTGVSYPATDQTAAQTDTTRAPGETILLSSLIAVHLLALIAAAVAYVLRKRWLLRNAGVSTE